MNYKDTLLMPETTFAMRGNLGVREIEIQEKWKNGRLYEKVLEKNKDAIPFILHDGPPYANGNIHIGHAFQKTLKDFVLRFKTMQGFYVPYVPGWDTHGLPIENEVTKKGINRKELTRAEFRKICRSFAIEQVEKQKVQFQRLGILGQWDQPYLTLDKTFISDQVRIFSKMVEKGLIYKGFKPIYWSPSSESAFAEAEIEYQDKQSKSIYLTFDITSKLHQGVKLLVWTTTPWTLPANLAISVHPKIDYVLFDADGVKYIAAESLLSSLKEKLAFKKVTILSKIKGKKLEGLTYKHPLYDRIAPVILGDHVTDTDGTGLVHTAPGHGEDDYIVGKKYKLDLLSPVDERGIMTAEAGPYEGQFYEKANDLIVEDLKSIGHLMNLEVITHSYPHDWRTRKPVIFRATPQWFASVAKIKESLLKAVSDVKWIPGWGELRISNMLKDREDWVISRQRAWGVPIPIFYDEKQEPILDPKLIDHIADLFEEYGSDCWYEWETKELLPKDYKGSISSRENDIMDVWFDSGTSYSVLNRRNLSFPADLYLEGSDQYRGWFNSSLITSVATQDISPYKRIVSHGFVLDGQGRAMSKSLGNGIDPLTVMKEQGADVLRLWVASVDYQADVRISKELMAQVSENYRKIRNTLRFMLGNISDFNPSQHYIGYSMRGNLNRVITLKFDKLVADVLNAYGNYDFPQVLRNVMPFIVNELSAYYLDYTKDILYIEKQDDYERQAVQSTIYDITLGLLKLLTPIMPHTMSEAYDSLPYRTYDDVYLESMPGVPNRYNDDLMKAFHVFWKMRDDVLKALEEARHEKTIGKSLQASLDLTLTKAQFDAVVALDAKDNLHQVLIVSDVHIKQGKAFEVLVKKADGHVCQRCWNVVKHVNDAGICSRCQHVLGGK